MGGLVKIKCLQRAILGYIIPEEPRRKSATVSISAPMLAINVQIAVTTFDIPNLGAHRVINSSSHRTEINKMKVGRLMMYILRGLRRQTI